jgi:hypothetical protein
MKFIVFGNYFSDNMQDYNLWNVATIRIADKDHLLTINTMFTDFNINKIFRMVHESDSVEDDQYNLPIEKWTYWVMDIEDETIDLDTLYRALVLQDNICWAALIEKNDGRSRINFYQQRMININVFKTYCSIDSILTKQYYDLLIKYDWSLSENNFINKAFFDFGILIDLPVCDMKSLQVFTILELILTHKTRNSDESIGNQLCSKIILLNNMILPKIDILKHFGNIPDHFTEKNMLEKIYLYRCCIAHGSDPDFNDKLQHLRNSETVYSLILQILRKVLVIALGNTSLLIDLKEC